MALNLGDLNDSLSTSAFSGDGQGTPCQKKKMRRSWFETPPPSKMEIAVERKKRRSSGTGRRKSDEEVETLTLTHFTSAPRIGFGNIKVGKAKSRILMIRNPHDYEQEVIVERFPYKKNFSIDSTRFTVEPEDYTTISITWAPVEAGNCREMMLFKVDGVYRLQAYVFGCAEEIKQKKPIKRGKKGLLGIKVKKPFSIISTPGLACIRDNYSPLDAEKPKQSNIKQHPVICEKFELLDVHVNENTPPPLESTAISVSSVDFLKNGERVAQLGCSPTFSPIFKRSEIDGSCYVADSLYSDTHCSILREVDNIPDGSKILSDITVKDNNILQDTPKLKKSQTSRSSLRNKSTDKDKENSPTKRLRTKSANDVKAFEREFLSPETFLNNSINPAKSRQPSPVKQIRTLASVSKQNSVSPNSFLEDMNNKNLDNTTLETDVPSPSMLLKDTIPHNLIVEQLKSVQSSLHEQSFENVITAHTVVTEKTVMQSSISVLHKTSRAKTQTFAKQDKKISAKVQKENYHQSPRRTTFLVSLKKNKASSKKEQDVSKSCKKADPASKEEKPKRRKILGSNKVGQTPVSKQSKLKEDSVNLKKSADTFAMVRTKESPAEATVEAKQNSGNPPIYQIFSGTVTKDRPSPNSEEQKKTSGKRLFEANSPKKETSPLARTVTKERPSPHIHNKVVGKKLFENDAATPIRTSPFIDEFGSPSILPTSPSETTGRRTTLTVTKSRPSDALLHATHTALSNVFQCTPTGKPSTVEGEEKTDICMVVDMSSGPILLKLDDDNKENNRLPVPEIFTQAPVSPNLIGSPGRLPTSPNPELGRRSTHLVTSPKIVDLSTVSPRKLFPPIPDSLDTVQEDKPLETSHPSVSEDIPSITFFKSRNDISQTISKNSCSADLPENTLDAENLHTSNISLKSMDDISKDLSKDISDVSIESEVSVKSLSRSSCNSSATKSKPSSQSSSPSKKPSTSPSKKPSTSPSKEPSTSPSKKPSTSPSKKTIRERKPSGGSVNRNDKNKSSAVFTVNLSPTSNKTKTKPPIPSSFSQVKSRNAVNSSVSRPPPSARRQSLTPASSKERLDLVGKSATDRRRSVNPALTKSEKKFEPLANLTKSTNNRNVPREDPALKSAPRIKKDLNSTSNTITKKNFSVNTSLTASVKKPRGPVKGVAQSKLMLIKKPKTAVPKHPMPFAARNMYYDERWQEKQERGFSHWLNFVLTPPEEYNNNVEKTKVDAGSIFVDGMNKTGGSTRLAPTKEVLSIRAYTARRRMNRLRRASCILYQSEKVIQVIRKVEIEVENRRLAVRKDKMIHADLGIKQNILDMLLCYNPLWLRIGLETIFGEMILIQSNNDVIGLSRFILYRLLSNPDVAAEYAHPTVPHLYRDGFAEATSSHTLKKFLLLVYFLDRAKESRLIDHDPCLFCKNADIKASKNLLVQFSRDCLSGEGDITKHLGYLGYIVSHIQTPLDEFDYAVSALGVDLRDGLRLARVMEYLTNDWTLLSQLRAPAISRLQKIHNVDVVLKVLADRGLDVSQLDMKLNARDVVDGHREKTLSLLWHIIFHFQVDVLIDIEQLKSEIAILEKTLRVKVSMQKLLRLNSENQARRDSGETDVLKNERLTLLLKWCRLVCLHYGIKIENFTVSFSDGRALCYLIHHYYPALLPMNLIKQQTTLGYMEEMENKEEEEFDEDASFDWSQTPQSDLEKPELFEQYLHNERENFKLLYEKVSGLGGIPMMLKCADMSNTIPDEKLVMTYIAHLCARLLDIRAESRAARVIQIAWRRYWLRHAVQKQEKLNQAATVIQKAYREYRLRQLEIKYTDTAVKIQSLWRGYKARKRAVILKKLKQNHKMSEAAITIQRALQSHLQHKQYLKMKSSAVKIQAVFRGYKARKELQNLHHSAQVIQLYYKGYKQTQNQMNRFRSIKSATIVLQKHFRIKLKRNREKEDASAVVIQKYVRSFLQRSQYRRKLKCIIRIQANFRRHKYQTKFLAMKLAAIVIQRYYRNYHYERLQVDEKKRQFAACLVIQTYWRQNRQKKLYIRNTAAVKIQSVLKGYLYRKQQGREKQAAIKIQSFFKMLKTRFEFFRLRYAAVVLQYHLRSYLQRKKSVEELRRQNSSATIIQSHWKGFKTRKQFTVMKNSVIKIQSFIRRRSAVKLVRSKQQAVVTIQQKYRAMLLGRQERGMFLLQKSSAIKIQAAVRSYKSRKYFQSLKTSAIKIQTVLRMKLARRSFLQKKRAVITLQIAVRSYQLKKKEQSLLLQRNTAATVIQAYYRGCCTRSQIRNMHRAATVIQDFYRGCCARSDVKKMHQAATVIQAYYRGSCARSYVQKMHQAATKIQAYYRSCCTRSNVKKMHQAATTIQAYYRGCCTRSHVKKMNHAATLIQANYRGCCIRSQVKKMHYAATLIQAFYRGSCTRSYIANSQHAATVIQAYYRGCCTRSDVKKMHQAATTIQAYYRGCCTRSHIKKMHQSATAIQACIRAYSAKRKYQNFYRTVLMLQKLYRNNRHCKTIRMDYLTKKTSAITIQRAFRNYLTKKNLELKNNAAIKVQSAVRSFLARKSFQKTKTVVSFLQQLYRRSSDTRKQNNLYLIQASSAILLQSNFRSYLARKSYRKQKLAAILVQSLYRMRSQRNRYLEIRSTCIKLQQIYRNNRLAKCERQLYLKKRNAVITIQASARCLNERRRYLKTVSAVVKIQALVRRHQQQNRYQKVKQSAIFLQQTFKNNRMAKIDKKHFIQKKQAAIQIQQVFRRYLSQKKQQKMSDAATVIQSLWRRYYAKKMFTEKRHACITIQRFYKVYKQGVQLKAKQLMQEQSALCIQKFWKNYKIRRTTKMEKAAIAIQSQFRGFFQRKEFKTVVKAVVCIQKAYRQYKCHKIHKKMVVSAAIIQKKWRATVLAREYRRRYLMTYGAIITIQACVRGFITRKTFETRQKQCIKIQACVRGFLQRRKYIRMKCAAIVLQNIYRTNRLAVQTRADFLQKKMAVLQIQKWYRSCKLKQTKQQMQAAVTIQTWYRCVYQKKIYCIFRAKLICVQSCVRRFLCQKQFQKHRSAILTIQRCVRTFLFVKKMTTAVAKRHQSAVKIQSTFRKYIRLKLIEHNSAATRIQSAYRAYYQRQLYKRTITHVIILQTTIRSYLTRQCYLKLLKQHQAAVSIQKCYRTYKHREQQKVVLEERKFYLYKVCNNLICNMSAITIQRWYQKQLLLKHASQHLPVIINMQRKVRARRERQQYLKLRQVVCKVQYGVRQWLLRRQKSATTIQRRVREWLIQHRLQKQQNKATKIQALWRGYMLRKKTHTKKLAEIRKRINKANESACEENKLGNRTTSALDYLLRYKHMNYVLEAVMHLEVATRLSPRCCERMVEVNAVNAIYRLMKSCNRSLPHMEVIKYSISILLNLAKYEKTTDYVYNVEDSITNLLELMTIFREKGNIFTKTCTLIGILAIDNNRSQAIASNSNHTDKIRSMYALTARKHKLQEGRNLVKAKIAQSRTFNSTLPLSTPAKKRRIRPDWILNRDSIHEIDNPMRAIKFVMDNLGLTPK